MTTISWDLTAILILFCGCVVVSGIVATLVKWALIRFTVELEYRVDSLEDRIAREVKVRGQERSVESRKSKGELLEWAEGQKEGAGAEPAKNSPLDQWRLDKMVGKK